MWYIDMTGGFSSAGLFTAMVNLIGDKKQQFIDACHIFMKKAPGFFHNGFSREEFFDLVYIKEQCRDISPLQNSEIIHNRENIFSILSKIIILSGEETINYFDFYLYFLVLVLLEEMNLKTRIRILTPRIGTSSPESVFSLLQGIVIILDPMAPAVTSMIGALCNYYNKLMIAFSSGRLLSVDYFPDPFVENNEIKIYECKIRNNTHIIADYDYDVVTVLETNIDDSTPEVISGVMAYVLKQGALDYTIAPVMMKKGRNGFHIQVLCAENNSDKIMELLLCHTSTFGVRKYETRRIKLKRRLEKIETKYGNITVKFGYRGNHLIKAVPEFDDLRNIAAARDIPLFNLYNEIMCEIKKGIDCFTKDGKIERL